MVAQIQTCLGVALTLDEDFPCAVCRLCSSALETFEALRERAEICDAILRNSRVEVPALIDSDVSDFKEECPSPEPELLIEQVVSSPVKDSKSNGDFLNNSNTIMVGDIKVELLNVVRKECKVSNPSEPKEKPKKARSMVECKICNLTFVKRANLDNHILTKHSTDNPGALAAALAAKRRRNPQNEPGDFKPISPKDIRKEMDMYSGSKKSPTYSCNKCNAQFSEWQPFMRHRKGHLNQKGPVRKGSN